MAVTWEVKITPINIDNYVASIEATRTETDETDPENIVIVSVNTYTVARAVIETTPQQLAAMDEIWAKHQLALAVTATINAFIVAKEIAGKANLEARE